MAVATLAIGAIPFFASPQGPVSRAGPADYVDSRTCASCHAKIDETYQRTGMARSFSRPSANAMGDFRSNNHYYHEASDTHFTRLERGGKYYQRRYQIGFEERETNVDELEIDYVLGSGNHARTYLHRRSEERRVGKECRL